MRGKQDTWLKNGTWRNPPQFEGGTGFSEGLAGVKISDKWGFIDQAGQPIIPAIYEKAKPFHNGGAFVKLIDGPWISIDRRGQKIKQ